MSTSRSTRADIAQQILDHASRLFARHGFDAVSLAQISKLVGIRKPSLLYHFRNKDTLRQAVLEELLVHWNDVLPKLLMAATSGTEQFDAVLSETVAFFADDRDRARLVLRELLDRPEQVQPLIETHVRPWVAIVCNYIRRGQEQGRLYFEVAPEHYVAHVTTMVMGSLATFDSLAALVPDEGDREALLEHHIRELLRIAKTSLFRPRPQASASPSPRPEPANTRPSEPPSDPARSLEPPQE